jgi:mycothiol synthase
MPLRDGYTLRHPRPDEASSVQTILDACETADTGEPRRHEDDVANEWRSPACRPGEDWWVAEAPGPLLAAVGWVWPQTTGEVTADHYVHPEHRGRGLGEALLDAIEARGAEIQQLTPGGVARRLVVWCEASDAVRRASLERRGFAAVRQYFEMEIGLTGGLQAPVWPLGIVARSFRPGVDDVLVYGADQEAFAEHHLFEPRDYDEWRLFHVDAPDGDVELWWLAWDGDELAGFVIPVEGDRGALIGDLAVRKPWRGRGIGRGLLLAAFATLRERGQTVARLMVDAQNVTGAVRVYEGAGLHISRRFDVMEKPLGR